MPVKVKILKLTCMRDSEGNKIIPAHFVIIVGNCGCQAIYIALCQ